MANKPLFHLSAKDVEVTVWNNLVVLPDNKSYDVKTITIHKNFVKDNVYNKTTSFKVGDIPKMVASLTAVYNKLTLNSDFKDDVKDELE